MFVTKWLLFVICFLASISCVSIIVLLFYLGKYLFDRGDAYDLENDDIWL